MRWIGRIKFYVNRLNSKTYSTRLKTESLQKIFNFLSSFTLEFHLSSVDGERWTKHHKSMKFHNLQLCLQDLFPLTNIFSYSLIPGNSI